MTQMAPAPNQTPCCNSYVQSMAPPVEHGSSSLLASFQPRLLLSSVSFLSLQEYHKHRQQGNNAYHRHIVCKGNGFHICYLLSLFITPPPPPNNCDILQINTLVLPACSPLAVDHRHVQKNQFCCDDSLIPLPVNGQNIYVFLMAVFVILRTD